MFVSSSCVGVCCFHQREVWLLGHKLLLQCRNGSLYLMTEHQLFWTETCYSQACGSVAEKSKKRMFLYQNVPDCSLSHLHLLSVLWEKLACCDMVEVSALGNVGPVSEQKSFFVLSNDGARTYSLFSNCATPENNDCETVQWETAFLWGEESPSGLALVRALYNPALQQTWRQASEKPR